MALSAPGIGSNLEVNGLVSQLMAIERQPLALSQQRGAKVQAQLSAYGLLQSQVALFGDAASSLGKPEKLFAGIAASAEAETASVGTGSTAPAFDPAVAVDGVTTNLAKAGPGAQSTSTMAQNNDGARQALREFVASYNALSALARGYTKYDAATKVNGALQGEVTAASVINELRATISGSIPGAAGDFTNLGDIGITLQADGSLKLDEGKLATATASGPGKLARLFTASASNPDTYVTRIKAFVDKTQGTSGLIPAKTEGLSTAIKRLDKEQESINLRLAGVEARLRRQFNAFDANLGSQNAVAAYMTNQNPVWSNAGE